MDWKNLCAIADRWHCKPSEVLEEPDWMVELERQVMRLESQEAKKA